MEGRTSPDPMYRSVVERSRIESLEIWGIALEYYFHPSRYPPEVLHVAEELTSKYNLMNIRDTYKVNIVLVLIFFILQGFFVFPDVNNPPFHTAQFAFPEIPSRFEDAIDKNYFERTSWGRYDKYAVFYLLSDRGQTFELKIFRYYSDRKRAYYAFIYFAPMVSGAPFVQEPRACFSLDLVSLFVFRNKWISLGLYIVEFMEKALYEKIGQARGDSPQTIWANRPLTKTSPVSIVIDPRAYIRHTINARIQV